MQLGGGCELALMADILLAAPNAQFGQPEVKVGTNTGGGGSQRLARAVSKSRTMEAVEWGMASCVVGEGDVEVVCEAVALAREIARESQLAVQAQKEAVNVGTFFVSWILVFLLRLSRGDSCVCWL